MKILTFIFSLSVVVCFSQEHNLARYVDPFIGTGGHGHTFPGAVTPFGMMQLSPDTRHDDSWDGCSGYYYSDTLIYGFSHTHLSGTGVSDWGDILLMPTSENSVDSKKYSSKFSHKKENASPGYYSVHLTDDDIDVAVTVTTRAGIYKCTFNKPGSRNVILDLTHRDKTLPGTYLRITSNTTIEGCRISQSWAPQQIIYYAIEFSRPFEYEVFLNDKSMKGKSADNNYFDGGNVKAIFSFNNAHSKTFYFKIGISSVSAEGAKKNLNTEIPGWNFDLVKENANTLWNKELSRIEIHSDKTNKLRTFYTALYHCMIHPCTASDVNGKYRGMDNAIHTAYRFTYYSVFSLWNTYRTLHPLFTIMERKRTLDFIKTFLEMYKQTGRLPVWELSANETDCMIGYHAASVITDAYLKGIQNFDTDLALQAMISMSNLKNYRGLDAYRQKGFLEVEDESESASKTLEYAYDDWCIAQFANAVRDDYTCKKYLKRAQSWKNIFNPASGFMQPRNNGGWQNNFDPKTINNDFVSGNGWEYAFYVPQDIPGLIKLMGDSEKFEAKLDEFFFTGNNPDKKSHTALEGIIGQYDHSNNPDLFLPYLYNYMGKPEKTRSLIKQMLDEFYKPAPDGLIGLENCGQLSAWYVMNAIGIYSVCPGKNYFDVGVPLFDKITLHLENGQTTVLSKQDTMYHHTTVPYFILTKTDKKEFNPLPNVKSIIPSPIISASSQIFFDSLLVDIQPISPNSSIEFSIRNIGESDSMMKKYTGPFYINTSKKITAIAQSPSGNSKPIIAKYYKRPHKWKIYLLSKYNAQYSAGGDQAVIDGLLGDENWRRGRWQGYQGKDFECILDLGKETKISKVSANFLQDTRSWILMPVKMDISFSDDSITFTTPFTVNNSIKPDELLTQIKNFELDSKNQHARYVKIKAYNYGKLPAWHEGAGNDAFIFIDEISIE